MWFILNRAGEIGSFIFLIKIQRNLNAELFSFQCSFFLTSNGLTLTGTVPISEKFFITNVKAEPSFGIWSFLTKETCFEMKMYGHSISLQEAAELKQQILDFFFHVSHLSFMLPSWEKKWETIWKRGVFLMKSKKDFYFLPRKKKEELFLPEDHKISIVL